MRGRVRAIRYAVNNRFYRPASPNPSPCIPPPPTDDLGRYLHPRILAIFFAERESS